MRLWLIGVAACHASFRCTRALPWGYLQADCSEALAGQKQPPGNRQPPTSTTHHPPELRGRRMLGALARTSISSTNGCTGACAVGVAACTATCVDAAPPAAPLPPPGAAPPAADGVPGAAEAAAASGDSEGRLAPGLGPSSSGGGRMASMVDM